MKNQADYSKSVQSSALLCELRELSDRFKKESAFLTNEHDSCADKMVGAAYKDCALEIDYVIRKHNAGSEASQ
jgi:hypothetical protein